jgi:hypothetical protein
VEYRTGKSTYITTQENPGKILKDAIVAIFARLKVLEVIYGF